MEVCEETGQKTPSGGGGREFESRHPDHLDQWLNYTVSNRKKARLASSETNTIFFCHHKALKVYATSPFTQSTESLDWRFIADARTILLVSRIGPGSVMPPKKNRKNMK